MELYKETLKEITPNEIKLAETKSPRECLLYHNFISSHRPSVQLRLDIINVFFSTVF